VLSSAAAADFLYV